MRISLLPFLMIIMVINVGLYLTQEGMSNQASIEGAIAPTIYNYQNSTMQNYDNGNGAINNDPSSLLPSANRAVSPTTGNYFTDLFTTAKDWFMGVTGLKYVLGIITAVPNLLTNIGLYEPIAFSLSALWYAITFLLIIMFLFGR